MCTQAAVLKVTGKQWTGQSSERTCAQVGSTESSSGRVPKRASSQSSLLVSKRVSSQKQLAGIQAGIVARKKRACAQVGGTKSSWKAVSLCPSGQHCSMLVPRQDKQQLSGQALKSADKWCPAGKRTSRVLMPK